MKQQIYDKLTEFFVSKNKKLEPLTAQVWVTKLIEKFDDQQIIPAIEAMIWTPDDFPTLGKLADIVESQEKEYILNIMHKASEDARKIASKAGVNLDKFNAGEFNHEATQRCIDRFKKKFKQLKEVQLANNEQKAIG